MIKDNYTGIAIANHKVIVQKLYDPREIKISITQNSHIPTKNEVDNIVKYLGEEGFLDYTDEDLETVENTKLQVGYLPKYKFKALETIINKNITHG
tara:strand:+ start:225 stop:512 length:288 start_codon:yes stop_codon:yes gene_type:complete